MSFEMPHYSGWFHTELPAESFWQKSEYLTDVLTKHNQPLVLKVSQNIENYNTVANYRFRSMNLVIKNCIKGGHKLNFKLLNANDNFIPFSIRLKMYKQIKCRDAQDESILIKLNN